MDGTTIFQFQKDGLWSSGIGKALLKFICIKPPSNATISLVGTGFGTDLTSGDILGEIVDSVTNLVTNIATTSVATDIQIAGKNIIFGGDVIIHKNTTNKNKQIFNQLLIIF